MDKCKQRDGHIHKQLRSLLAKSIFSEAGAGDEIFHTRVLEGQSFAVFQLANELKCMP